MPDDHAALIVTSLGVAALFLLFLAAVVYGVSVALGVV